MSDTEDSADWLDQLSRGDDRAWARFYAVYDPVITSITGWQVWSFSEAMRREAGQRIRWQLTRVIDGCPRDASITYWIKLVCTRQCLVYLREIQAEKAAELVPAGQELDDAQLIPLLDRMVDDGVHGERYQEKSSSVSRPRRRWDLRQLAALALVVILVPLLVLGGFLLRDRMLTAELRKPVAPPGPSFLLWDREGTDQGYGVFHMQFRNAFEAAVINLMPTVEQEPDPPLRLRADFARTADQRVVMEVHLYDQDTEEPRREWTLLFEGEADFGEKIDLFAAQVARYILLPPKPPEIPIPLE